MVRKGRWRQDNGDRGASIGRGRRGLEWTGLGRTGQVHVHSIWVVQVVRHKARTSKDLGDAVTDDGD